MLEDFDDQVSVDALELEGPLRRHRQADRCNRKPLGFAYMADSSLNSREKLSQPLAKSSSESGIVFPLPQGHCKRILVDQRISRSISQNIEAILQRSGLAVGVWRLANIDRAVIVERMARG